MTENIQKISRVLINPVRNLFLRIHVKLINDKKDGRKENFHNIFTMDNGNSYLQLDLQSFLTLEIKDGQWASDKSVLLDQRNIYQVIKGFERVLNNIYNGGIFAVNKNKKIVMYADKREEHTERIYNIGTNQRLVIQPAIIYDENETEYEGVILYVNRTENYVELPIDAFEALYHTIKETNMFVYSQQLVNYYMSTINKIEVKQNVINNGGTAPKKKHPLLKGSTEQDEFAKSTITPKQSEAQFFGFEEKSK